MKATMITELLHSIEDTSREMWTWNRFVAELPSGMDEHIIGESEGGQPVYGFRFGEGPKVISLMAGAHADEPAGPNTLYRLTLEFLHSPEKYARLFSRFQFLVIPHVNPDGDAANAVWIEKWPDPVACMTNPNREPPGRDLEFGFPEMRVENRAASDFWRSCNPADLHVSLHGMLFSEGYLLLLNDEWEARTREWRPEFDRLMRSEGLKPHDHDRKGEKGFNYFGPGFSSTPKGSAMKQYFVDIGDMDTAGRFYDSSMEFHLKRNPDVLCMVTEFPLFLVPWSGTAGIPGNYLRLKDRWRNLMERRPEGKNVPDTEWQQLKTDFNMIPLPIEKAIRLQLQTIQYGMERI